MLQKTLAVEQRQKQRLIELTMKKERELEEAKKKKMCEVTTISTALMDQEEAQRKDLMNDLVQNSAPGNGPVIKVLTNVQGK